MRARIFYPARSAMQSGPAQKRQWCLRFIQDAFGERDAMTGWQGKSAPASQLVLRFASRAEAIAYAEKHKVDYEVEPEPTLGQKQKDYTLNFSAKRRTAWTH